MPGLRIGSMRNVEIQVMPTGIEDHPNGPHLTLSSTTWSVFLRQASG
ncbi:DUF397 domain-containing protein [Streptomyces sp. ADMS]|nr:DUF397 domain-containing protein [Streptomyces sp. ADMS]MDW4910257.1 DUF397 domain-containing protein [Streptomyces sp. ADMS]